MYKVVDTKAGMDNLLQQGWSIVCLSQYNDKLECIMQCPQ